MSSDAPTTASIVLTGDGRAWVRARLDRATERLARVDDELRAERSAELLTERGHLVEQLNELTQVLRRAVAPADVTEDPTIVELGDEVEVEFPDESRETFLVVHPIEAGMDDHRTSAAAPLARAVLGRRPGERVTVRSPAGVYACTIVRRERIG